MMMMIRGPLTSNRYSDTRQQSTAPRVHIQTKVVMLLSRKSAAAAAILLFAAGCADAFQSLALRPFRVVPSAPVPRAGPVLGLRNHNINPLFLKPVRLSATSAPMSRGKVTPNDAT